MLIEQHQSRVLAHIVKVLLVIGEVLAVEDLLARQIEVVEEDIFVGEEGLVAHGLQMRDLKCIEPDSLPSSEKFPDM